MCQRVLWTANPPACHPSMRTISLPPCCVTATPARLSSKVTVDHKLCSQGINIRATIYIIVSQKWLLKPFRASSRETKKSSRDTNANMLVMCSFSGTWCKETRACYGDSYAYKGSKLAHVFVFGGIQVGTHEGDQMGRCHGRGDMLDHREGMP